MTAETGRGLILDANILIRLVLGARVRELVLDHADLINFFAPEECFVDARRYLPDLLRKRGVDPADALTVLDVFEGIVRPVPEIAYLHVRDEALARIEHRDARDWPILAAALALGCPIWTEDQDFFGTGVPVWTTDRVRLYLDPRPSRGPVQDQAEFRPGA